MGIFIDINMPMYTKKSASAHEYIWWIIKCEMVCVPIEPPSEPREPGIVDFDNKSVTLRWNRPMEDGGRPITHFIIQKKDKFGGKK